MSYNAKPIISTVLDENGVDWPRATDDRCAAVIPSAAAQLAGLEEVSPSPNNKHLTLRDGAWRLAVSVFPVSMDFNADTRVLTLTMNTGQDITVVIPA